MPMEINLKPQQVGGDSLPDPLMCQQLVGNLNYLIITRPDISFDVQQASQFIKAHSQAHFAVTVSFLDISKGHMFEVRFSF